MSNSNSLAIEIPLEGIQYCQNLYNPSWGLPDIFRNMGAFHISIGLIDLRLGRTGGHEEVALHVRPTSHEPPMSTIHRGLDSLIFEI